MANFTFNIAKGRVVELYNRVKSNDPANSAIIAVPLTAAGIETQAVLQDKDDLAAVLAGTTDEQATMGRKTLTDADVAALPAPDDVNDRYSLNLPNLVWAGATGVGIAQILICYDSDTTAGTDANVLPLFAFDFAQTPNGSDLQATGGEAFRAS